MKKQDDFFPGINDGDQARNGSRSADLDDQRTDQAINRRASVTKGDSGVAEPAGHTKPVRGERSRFTSEQIQQIGGMLKAKANSLSVVSPAKSMQETIKILAPQIRSLLVRGCTLEEVVADLRRTGLSISTSTLNGYLPKKRRKPAVSIAEPVGNQTGLTVQQFDMESL